MIPLSRKRVPSGNGGLAAGCSPALLTVLVVDDQSTMRSILRRTLASLNITRVLEAGDGASALAILESPQGQDCDLIISDLNMPGMDGLAFCNKVRRTAELRERHLPILMVTAERDEMVLDVASQVGAGAVLPKPFGAPELRDKIEQLVGVRFS
jgi:two-component system chemotaxis response regulator CheY